MPTLEEFSRLLNLPYDRDKLILPFGHGGKGNFSAFWVFRVHSWNFPLGWRGHLADAL